MHNATKQLGLLITLTGILGCRGGAGDETGNTSDSSGQNATPAEQAASSSTMTETDPGAAGEGWSAGDTIPSGKAGVPDIQILEVHKNGQGAVCGSGKSATLAYKAMLADGTVLDPGTRPFSFAVGAGKAIEGWDVVVARMRVGDSFTILLPQQLAYGPSKGDLKFDMELLSVR